MRKIFFAILIFISLGLNDSAFSDDTPDTGATPASTVVGTAGGQPSFR